MSHYGQIAYESGKRQAQIDIDIGTPLDQLRATWENCQCGDSYDQGYNTVLLAAERMLTNQQSVDTHPTVQ